MSYFFIYDQVRVNGSFTWATLVLKLVLILTPANIILSLYFIFTRFISREKGLNISPLEKGGGRFILLPWRSKETNIIWYKVCNFSAKFCKTFIRMKSSKNGRSQISQENFKKKTSFIFCYKYCLNPFLQGKVSKIISNEKVNTIITTHPNIFSFLIQA